MTTHVTALIADDEPLLARALHRALTSAWPELDIVAIVHDGTSAIESALTLQPQVMFLDIQMPNANGLEVAAGVADDWSSDAATPLLVYVTAFDQYAIAAFEHAAVDYVLKPINTDRIAAMVARLKKRLEQVSAMSVTSSDAASAVMQAQSIDRARQAIDSNSVTSEVSPKEKITVLRIADRNNVRMVALRDVIAIEANDKYANVITENGEGLVRLSLRELIARIDGISFTQIHRGALVASDRIELAQKDEAGHYWLHLKGCKRPFKVSRAFSHLFKPM
jgi:DNA-binding LytR/AlgR family response regulator